MRKRIKRGRHFHSSFRRRRESYRLFSFAISDLEKICCKMCDAKNRPKWKTERVLERVHKIQKGKESLNRDMQLLRGFPSLNAHFLLYNAKMVRIFLINRSLNKKHNLVRIEKRAKVREMNKWQKKGIDVPSLESTVMNVEFYRIQTLSIVQ